MRAPSPAREIQRDFLAETQAGFSYIISQPVILGLTVMEAFVSIFGLDHALLTILASDVFRVGAHGFGFLQSARGLGAVIGSSVFITLGQGPEQGRILFVSALLYGAGFALFGLSPSFSLALVLLTFVGATDMIWSASRGTILQMLAPEKFRGRVMGVLQLSNRGLHPLGQLESGIMVPLLGARETTIMGGAIISVITLLTGGRVPAIARFRWDSEKIEAAGAKAAAEDAMEKLNEPAAQTKL
jgi:MFS family permease